MDRRFSTRKEHINAVVGFNVCRKLGQPEVPVSVCGLWSESESRKSMSSNYLLCLWSFFKRCFLAFDLDEMKVTHQEPAVALLHTWIFQLSCYATFLPNLGC